MKRSISVLLVLLMIMTILPIGVSADTTEPAKAVVTDSAGVVIQNNGKISTVEGELNIQLDDATSAQTALSTITLKKTDGSDIKGACVCKANDSIITVKFGRLEEGEYTLSIPAADETITFTAEEEYLTKQTFDTGYVPAQGTDNLTYQYGENQMPPDDISGFVSVENGHIKMKHNVAPDADTGFGLLVTANGLPDSDFNNKKNVDADMVYVVDADLSVNGTTNVRKYFGTKYYTGSDGYVIDRSAIDKLPVWGATDGTKGIAMLIGTTFHGNYKIENNSVDGWFKPRMVLRRDADGKLASDLYNRVNNSFIGTDDYTTDAAVNHIGVFVMRPTKSTGEEMHVDNIYVRPERLMSVLKTDYSTSDKTITLYMSDDIAEATAEKIKVKNGDAVVENYSVDVDNNNRTITLDFADELVEGNYSINIAGVQSSNGINSYAGEMFNLMVEDKTALVPVSSVPDGGTISTIAGEIKISFGHEIDPSTVTTNSIKLNKANNEPIKGAYTVTTSGKGITVQFGRLESDVEYALTVENSVLTVGNVPRAVESKTFTFTAEEEYLTKQTFDTGYVPAQGTDNLTYQYGENQMPPDDISGFVSVENGHIKMKHNVAPDADTGFGLLVTANGLPDSDFNNKKNVDADMVYVVDADLSVNGTTNVRKYFGTKYYTGSDGYVIDRSAIDKLPVWGATDGTKGIAMLIGTTFHGNYKIENNSVDGWFKPRMVLRRDADGKLASDLYNRVNNSFIGTDDYTTDAAVNHIGVFVMRPTKSTGEEMHVDNIYVRPERLMSVLKTDYSTSDKTITLYMSDDIAEATAEKIKVKNGDAVVTGYEVAVDNNNRAVILTFENGFDSSSYSFDISNMMSANGIKAYSDSKTISIPYMSDPVYTDGNGNIIDSDEELTAATTISVSASISGVENVVGILAVYDKIDGSLINTTFASITSNGELTATLTGLDAGTTKEVKLFIWKDLTTITPLFPCDCL